MKQFKILALLLTVCSLQVTAQECDTTNAAFETIVKKYEQKYQEMAPDTSQGPWSNSLLASLNLDIDFSMVDKKLSFDLVSVTMRNRRMSFNTPQMTMQNKKIRFTIYEPGMEKCVIGYKPEVKGLEIKMTKIYGKCPGMVKKEKTIVTKIPAFTYATTGFTTKIPEFKRDKKEIIMKLPKVVVTKVSAKAETLRDDAEKLEKEYNKLSIGAKEEMSAEIVKTFTCQRNALAASRDTVQTAFNAAIAEVDASIKSIKDNGADPAKVVDENGTTVDLLQTRNELLNDLSTALASFDEAIAQLVTSEKEALEALN